MATKLIGSITNVCRPVAGIEEKVWLFNRSDFTRATVNNTLTSIGKIGSVVAYTATVAKQGANVGHDATVFTNLCTAFVHKLMINFTTGNAANMANIDKADDLMAVVKGKDGILYAYGVKNGLWKNKQSQMINDNNALVACEYGTIAGQEEEYSVYFYTGTEASLDLLLV